MDLEVPVPRGRTWRERMAQVARDKATQLAGEKEQTGRGTKSLGPRDQPDTASIRASDLTERKWP